MEKRRPPREIPGIAASSSAVTQRSDQARVALLLRQDHQGSPARRRIDGWLAYNFPFVTESLVEKPVVL
jgi:hypothetical protein